MLDFHIVIPARLASTRLTNKMLMPLGGKPLLQHTYEAALKAGAASVTIATDHEEIVTAMQGVGAKVLLTRKEHETGTDRIAEAVNLLKLPEEAIVVNLQGDEPLMPPALLRQVAENLVRHSKAAIATLCESVEDLAHVFDPAIVKVVLDKEGYALYFSRAPIPWDREQYPKNLGNAVLRHLGVYAYRAHFLHAYQNLSPAPIEKIEKLEQLRALYHGFKIHVEVARQSCPPGIDTQADFDHISRIVSTP